MQARILRSRRALVSGVSAGSSCGPAMGLRVAMALAMVWAVAVAAGRRRRYRATEPRPAEPAAEVAEPGMIDDATAIRVIELRKDAQALFARGGSAHATTAVARGGSGGLRSRWMV